MVKKFAFNFLRLNRITNLRNSWRLYCFMDTGSVSNVQLKIYLLGVDHECGRDEQLESLSGTAKEYLKSISEKCPSDCESCSDSDECDLLGVAFIYDM